MSEIANAGSYIAHGAARRGTLSIIELLARYGAVISMVAYRRRDTKQCRQRHVVDDEIGAARWEVWTFIRPRKLGRSMIQ